MALTKEKKEEIVKKYARGEKDTGSAEVQIAILTEEIKELTEHLAKKDVQRYREVVKSLGLRK